MFHFKMQINRSIKASLLAGNKITFLDLTGAFFLFCSVKDDRVQVFNTTFPSINRPTGFHGNLQTLVVTHSMSKLAFQFDKSPPYPKFFFKSVIKIEMIFQKSWSENIVQQMRACWSQRSSFLFQLEELYFYCLQRFQLLGLLNHFETSSYS